MRCCFIGHRDADGLEYKIRESIEKLIKMGVTEFYSGGMGQFDRACEFAVKRQKGKLVFIPYNIRQVKKEYKLWYDNIICPFGEKEYSAYDIPKRNKWMVDNCDICLCYIYKEGGAKKTFEYALKKNKKIINLFE